MAGIVNIFRKLKHFLSEDIWRLDIEDFSRAKARSIKYLKVLLITIKTFSAEKIGFQAVALSFFGTMSVVPFIAVAFAITGGFGLTDKLKKLLYEYFSNSQETIDMVLGFAENIIDTAQSSVMGLLSALLFVWLVFWMMISVERVFNNVWRVKKSRNIFKRISFYIVATLTFSAMYKFIPNYKVLYPNALRAAAISAFAFTVLQYLYLETQLFVTRLNMVYGAVAAIPLFMFWMNFGWFIILFGADLSYAYQHVDNYNIE